MPLVGSRAAPWRPWPTRKMKPRRSGRSLAGSLGRAVSTHQAGGPGGDDADMETKVVKGALGLVLAIAFCVAVAGPDTTARAEQNTPQQGGGRGGGRGFSLPPLLMETDAFPDGGVIPQKYVGRGGVQPGFKFSNAPATTVSYALIFHDLDVALQGGTGDVLHWIAWNIPASA